MRRNMVVNEVGTGATLPRVADLEHSVQWTSLANDIDDLVKLRRPDRSAVVRRDKRDGRTDRHAYQRVSMPEMQRTCTVHFEDDCDTLLRRDRLSPENSRWSWKPRTDFEREYFYKDYKDYYRGDPGKCLESVSHETAPRDRGCSRETRHPSSRSPAARGSSAARYPEGLEKEHFSDSRERLHEIFEHNRYLRRQFFADMPGKQDSCSGFAGNASERRGQGAPRRCAGFGSTETLTSQSNQSSVSSINDRKSRAQTTRSPEEEEEEEEEMDTLTEFAGRDLSRIVNRKSGGRARRDGRVLVNILPGSEIRRVDVRNVSSSVKLDEASNERSEGSPIVEEARFRDAACAKRTHDKSCQCRIEEDEIDLDASRRGKNLPEYIFGGAAKIDFESREEGGDSSGGSGHRDASNVNDRLSWDDKPEREWNRLSQNETRMICDYRGRSDSVSAKINEISASRSNDGVCWDLCRSLPNLTILKRNLDAPLYVARAVNVPEGLESLESPDARVVRSRNRFEQRSGQREEIEDQTRSIERGQSISKLTTDVSVPPKHLTPPRRGVKATRIPPPPLDLSTVNERCERMEADERRYLNDYSVDVAILRNHEDHVEDLLSPVESRRAVNDVVKDDILSRIANGRNDQPLGRDADKRRRSSGVPGYKSCGNFSLAEDLQSPQLVNNCKSSTSDLRKIDPASILPIDPDACRRDRATSSPLFDQTSPIGGLHAAGSALPSTVYGPIPYSQ
ncbi:uncharacterized protein LOC105428169 [Pogonomyrmex barbatus]|uniref:Uncharacterized protein LOC105428169 n=1 Tax=Pogonomyrmex barbatus TaxID=144034 RepID=A0A6I9W8U5_9HYME|nr:uncharacterized protein LOC105428169 [Pogonomyrmex barbatus]